MMIILLFLSAVDSVPPLPDLSKIFFPEPPFYISPPPCYVSIRGYGGEFIGASFNSNLQYFCCRAWYEDKVDWDTTQQGYAHMSYAISLPGLWVQPAVTGYLYRRDTEYRTIAPQLDISSTNPWSMINGRIAVDVWSIDQEYHIEQTTYLEFIFDRTLYCPHMSVLTYYLNDEFITILAAQLHIRNLHVQIGSPVNMDFPSPWVTIQYTEPWLSFKGKAYSGAQYKTIKDCFDPELPIRYTHAVPHEQIAIGAEVGTETRVKDNTFDVKGVYNKWERRLTVGRYFGVGIAENIQEVDVIFSARNAIEVGSVKLLNAMHLQHNWSDTVIVFEGTYSLTDSFSLHLGGLRLLTEVQYLSKRQGLEVTIPQTTRMNCMCSMQYRCITAFVQCDNINNTRNELYDGYCLAGRQYAGGLIFTIAW